MDYTDNLIETDLIGFIWEKIVCVITQTLMTGKFSAEIQTDKSITVQL